MKRSVPVVVAIVANVVWIAIPLGSVVPSLGEIFGHRWYLVFLFLGAPVFNVLVLWTNPQHTLLALQTGILNVIWLGVGFLMTLNIMWNPLALAVAVSWIVVPQLTLFALWSERQRSR